MKITILGCGTSSGVPRIGPDWGRCDPTEPRNRRTRPSVLVEADGFALLIDTSPDLRMQLLEAGVGAIDAVLWTHEHADHCHGIDDLRQVMRRRTAPIAGYAEAMFLDILVPRFAYAFEGSHGYPPLIEPIELQVEQRIGPFEVRPLRLRHGPGWSTAFRIDHGRGAMAYATDWSLPDPAMMELFSGVDLFVTDALRRNPHPSHAHLGMALGVAAEVNARMTLLTHMDPSMDYRTLSQELPVGVRPSYDGQVIEIAP